MKKTLAQFRNILFLLIGVLPAFARAELPPGNPVTFDVIGNILGIISRFLISISLVLAIIFIVISGIMMMYAQGNPEKFKTGLQRLKSAIIGIMVVMATGVIINTVLAVVDRTFFCQISVLGICLY